jgi:hypothetical protein
MNHDTSTSGELRHGIRAGSLHDDSPRNPSGRCRAKGRSQMMPVTGRPSALIHAGVIAASVVLLGCGGESDTVRIHAEIGAQVFDVGVFTADGAGFCPTGTFVPSNVEPVEGTDGLQTFVQKQYECDDDSGIFFIETIMDLPYDVASDPVNAPPEGTLGSGVAWSLEPGFGDYTNRSGSGEATIEIEGGLFVFDGTLSTD